MADYDSLDCRENTDHGSRQNEQDQLTDSAGDFSLSKSPLGWSVLFQHVGVITHSLLTVISHRFWKAVVAKCIIGSILLSMIYRLPQIQSMAK